jgi:alpha-glucosidase (family GH31 glycosyl hydrolase)
VVAIFRRFANLRMNLMPYILSQAYASSQSGLPLMRALPIEFPGDMACREYPSEYLFGEALLVAPVVEEDSSSWTVYLPEGEWLELWSGTVFQGPSEIVREVPPDRIPVFQRKGSLLALNLDGSGQLGSPVGNATTHFDHLTLQVFPGGSLQAYLILADSNEPAVVTVEPAGGGNALALQIPRLEDDVDVVIFRNVPSSVSMAIMPLPRMARTTTLLSEEGWQWDIEKHTVRVHVAKNRTSGILFIE